jgi:hypothetical protein
MRTPRSSTTLSSGRCSNPATSAAVHARSNLTSSRRIPRRSASSRSTLQPSRLAKVPGAPPDLAGMVRSSRSGTGTSASCCRLRTLNRPATTSKASGKPSSFRHISAAAPALAGLSSKPGVISESLSTKRRTDGTLARASSDRRASHSGRGVANGDITAGCRPVTSHGTRDVLITRMPAQRASNSSTPEGTLTSATPSSTISASCWPTTRQNCETSSVPDSMSDRNDRINGPNAVSCP